MIALTPESSNEEPKHHRGFALAIRQKPKLADCLVAIALVGLAFILTLALRPYFLRIITPSFFLAVTLTGWLAGFWAAMLATVLSVAAVGLLLQPGDVTSDVVGLTAFALVAALTSSINASRRHAEHRLRLQHEELNRNISSRTEELEVANRILRIEISERQRMEQVLRENEERFRTLFEEAPVAYHEIDAQGRITRVNRCECEMFGYEPGEMIGRRVTELVAPSQRALSQEQVLDKLSRRRSDLPVFSRQMVRKDGSTFVAELHESQILDAEGRITGIRTALFDISERLQAEEQVRQLNAELERRVQERTRDLERSNEALQQFAYGVSHDLQEPLRMISSYAQLLEKRAKHLLDEDCREFLSYITDGCDRLSRMIRDLLAFSRVATQSGPIETVDMAQAVESALWNLQGLIEDTGATVTVDPMPQVFAPQASLAQVLQNLIGNALKYRGEATPRIQVTARQEENHWIFCVADNGTGFDPAHAKRVFGIFQRLHGREYPGTGMGLAIAKRIVERYGGSIWAESKPGRGSKFYFSLPATVTREKP
jgi:PAS domain S-box-containing protein